MRIVKILLFVRGHHLKFVWIVQNHIFSPRSKPCDNLIHITYSFACLQFEREGTQMPIFAIFFTLLTGLGVIYSGPKEKILACGLGF